MDAKRDRFGRFTSESRAFLGRRHSLETIEKLRLAKKRKPVKYWLGKKRPEMSGNKHPNWKEKVSYSYLHGWVAKKYGSLRYCEICRTRNAKKFEWANISGQYDRKRSDWIRVCTYCHMNLDGHFGYLNRKKK